MSVSNGTAPTAGQLVAPNQSIEAGHGFLFQYPAEFAGEVETFLSTTGPRRST